MNQKFWDSLYDELEKTSAAYRTSSAALSARVRQKQKAAGLRATKRISELLTSHSPKSSTASKQGPSRFNITDTLNRKNLGRNIGTLGAAGLGGYLAYRSLKKSDEKDRNPVSTGVRAAGALGVGAGAGYLGARAAHRVGSGIWNSVKSIKRAV